MAVEVMNVVSTNYKWMGLFTLANGTHPLILASRNACLQHAPPLQVTTLTLTLTPTHTHTLICVESA